MATKPSCSLAFVIFSWAFMGFCQGQGGGGGGGGGGGNGGNPECVSKLLPCQPYLHSATPPGSCCVPLKEVVTKDVKCLCEVFNNPAIMKSLNVTQDDALKLAKTCGANADTSLCKTAASPTVSPGTPSSSNSSSTNSTASAPAKSAATTHVMISHFGGSLFLAILMSLLLFAF